MPLTDRPVTVVTWILQHAFDNTDIDEDLFLDVTFGATLAVTGATNATPIVITTSTAHGYSTGMVVEISGVGGNTAANGIWTITVVNSTQFSLQQSAGNGNYTSGGVVKRRIRARGKSNYMGTVRIGRDAIPWNPCSMAGGTTPGGQPRRHIY